MSFLSKVNARYQVQIVAAPERHNPSAEWAKEQSEESQFNPNYHVQSSTETVKSGLFLHKYHDEGKKWDYYLLSSSPNIKDHKAVISHRDTFYWMLYRIIAFLDNRLVDGERFCMIIRYAIM